MGGSFNTCFTDMARGYHFTDQKTHIGTMTKQQHAMLILTHLACV